MPRIKTYLFGVSEFYLLDGDTSFGKKDYQRRIALARLPVRHDLNDYDFNFSDDIGRQEMKELWELVWMR